MIENISGFLTDLLKPPEAELERIISNPFRMMGRVLIMIPVWIVILIISFLFPLNYLVWSVFNRKAVSSWFLLLFDLTLIAIPYQFYILIRYLPVLRMLSFGGGMFIEIIGYSFLLFLGGRFASNSGEKAATTKKTRYFMKFIILITPIVNFIALYFVMRSIDLFNGHAVTPAIISAKINLLALIVVWSLLQTMVLLKYPEDGLIETLWHVIPLKDISRHRELKPLFKNENYNQLLTLAALFVAVLISPVYSLIWSVYNWKRINIWLIVLVNAVILVLAYQLYSKSSLSPDSLYLFSPIINFLILYGLLQIFFILLRSLSYYLDWQEKSKRAKYFLLVTVYPAVFIGLVYSSVLNVIKPCVHKINIICTQVSPILLTSTAAIILVFILLLVFLSVIYPKDGFADAIEKYYLAISGRIGSSSQENKG